MTSERTEGSDMPSRALDAREVCEPDEVMD